MFFYIFPNLKTSMSVEIILIILSSLVVFSYLFDLIAKRFKIPSVILLLLSGMGLRYLSSLVQLPILNFEAVLPLIGTVGLILIVLEGSLELRLEHSKSGLIKKSMGSALFILLLTTVAIALYYYFTTSQPIRICFLNAIPLGVISSAIAIPSASALPIPRKEFIVYESSLSDIFGIVIFNFVLTNQVIGAQSFLLLGWDTLLILVLSGIFCLLLLYLLNRITHHLKFFLILAVLILVYAIGKHYHLPTLVIVLAFGLFLNNLHWIRAGWFIKNFMYDNFQKDLNQLNQLSGESAFLVRTFFFLIFGYSLNLASLASMDVFISGSIIIGLIFVIRIAFLKVFVSAAAWAEYFLAPRGLITILLFFSIPDNQRISSLTNGLLFFIILVTSLIMTIGLLSRQDPNPPPPAT